MKTGIIQQLSGFVINQGLLIGTVLLFLLYLICITVCSMIVAVKSLFHIQSPLVSVQQLHID